MIDSTPNVISPLVQLRDSDVPMIHNQKRLVRNPTCDFDHYEVGLCVITLCSDMVDVHLPMTRLLVSSAMTQLHL
jgi:hypothetical protein